MRWLALFSGGLLDGQEHEVDAPVQELRSYWQRHALTDSETLELCSGYRFERGDVEARVVEYVAS